MSRRSVLLDRLSAPVVCFAASFTTLVAMLVGFPVLYDTDSYLHLAIARLYATDGLVDALPWARASILGSQYGDKELLFHVLLMPLVSLGSLGGRLALAGLGASIATAVGLLARRAIGSWGWWVPAFLFLGSSGFLSRMIRLRPELLSLLLLLAAVWLAGERRWRWLGLVAFVYSLSYTAFHALLVVVLLIVAQAAWRDRRIEWAGVLYPILGIAIGLLVHPQFPNNLLIWKIQSIDFFQWKAMLDVGPEIRAPRGDELAFDHWPLALALLALWRAAVRPGTSSGAAEEAAPTQAVRRSDAFAVAAVAFGGLALLGLRFVTYGAPFVALAVVWWIARSGRSIGPRVHLPWRGSLSTTLVLGLLLAAGAGRTALWAIQATGPDGPTRGVSEREKEWSTFGGSVPAGAKVAAEWGSAALYSFWAPQGRYLNVFDPVFMAWLDPEAYAVQRAVFNATEPDLAMALRDGLDSDYLAVSRFHQTPALHDRLVRDPRIQVIYNRWTQLWQVVPDPEASAVMDDWKIRTLAGERHDYPRVDRPELREIEAFIDGRRMPRDWWTKDCITAVREEERTERDHRFWEVSATGPIRIVVDGVPVFATENEGATMGSGYLFVVDLEPGAHKWIVRSCAGPGGFPAFSLRERREIGPPDPAGLAGARAGAGATERRSSMTPVQPPPEPPALLRR